MMEEKNEDSADTASGHVCVCALAPTRDCCSRCFVGHPRRYSPAAAAAASQLSLPRPHRPTHPHSLSRDSSLLGFDLDARRVSGALPSRTHTLPGRRVSISFRPRNVTDANYRPRQHDGSIQQRAISPAQPVCNASLGAECPTTRPHMVVRVSSAEIGLRAFVIGDILAISRNARASSMRCCLSPTHRPHPPLPFPLTSTTLADREPHDGATTSLRLLTTAIAATRSECVTPHRLHIDRCALHTRSLALHIWREYDNRWLSRPSRPIWPA